MKNKLTKVYLDGRYPCIIVCDNYENTGMVLIKHLRYKMPMSGFVVHFKELKYFGTYTQKQLKKLKEWCINNES